jgi:methionine aminotransferase
MIEMAGGKSIGVPLNYNKKSDQFELDYNALQKAVDSPKAKILLLNSPHNPSGKLFSEQEYLKIANIVNKNNNLLVLSDEVYERVVFDN